MKVQCRKEREGAENMSFAEESQVYELKQSPGVDNSHSLDDTFEYVDPPEPVLNLCTPELKVMEYNMEKLFEEYIKQQHLVIDTSGCLGDDRECPMCTGSDNIPLSQMLKSFPKK